MENNSVIKNLSIQFIQTEISFFKFKLSFRVYFTAAFYEKKLLCINVSKYGYNFADSFSESLKQGLQEIFGININNDKYLINGYILEKKNFSNIFKIKNINIPEEQGFNKLIFDEILNTTEKLSLQQPFSLITYCKFIDLRSESCFLYISEKLSFLKNYFNNNSNKYFDIIELEIEEYLNEPDNKKGDDAFVKRQLKIEQQHQNYIYLFSKFFKSEYEKQKRLTKNLIDQLNLKPYWDIGDLNSANEALDDLERTYEYFLLETSKKKLKEQQKQYFFPTEIEFRSLVLSQDTNFKRKTELSRSIYQLSLILLFYEGYTIKKILNLDIEEIEKIILHNKYKIQEDIIKTCLMILKEHEVVKLGHRSIKYKKQGALDEKFFAKKLNKFIKNYFKNFLELKIICNIKTLRYCGVSFLLKEIKDESRIGEYTGFSIDQIQTIKALKIEH